MSWQLGCVWYVHEAPIWTQETPPGTVMLGSGVLALDGDLASGTNTLCASRAEA